jgi:hypothetical protein
VADCGARAAGRPDAAHRLAPAVGRKRSPGEGFSAFIHALAGLGWTEGRNVRIDLRWYGGDTNRIRALAQELVGLQPDIIVTDATPATATFQRETRTIPIVFASGIDDKFPELSRCQGKRHAPKVDDSVPHPWIAKARIDFSVERLDYFDGRILRRADSEPTARLEPRDEFTHGAKPIPAGSIWLRPASVPRHIWERCDGFKICQKVVRKRMPKGGALGGALGGA